jgi:hypothetical protein
MRGVVVTCLVAVAALAHADVPSDPQAAVDAAIDQGDAWNVAIPKIVAILGQPAIASDDHIEWAMMVKDMCLHVVAMADADGFVRRVETNQMVLDTEGGPACAKLVTKKAKLPAHLRGPRPLDADAQARTIVAQWGAGKFDEMLAAAHPEFRQGVGSSDTIARLAKRFEMRAGKFVKLGSPLEHAFKDSAWVVSAPVIYEKGTLHAAISFVPYKGKPVLVNFELKLPKELQAKPDPKDAARAARSSLDLLLAANTAAFYEHMHSELVKKLPRATLEPQLADVLEKIGKVTAIKLTEQKPCDDRQCFTFEVKAANGTSKATFDMTFMIADWVIYGFDLEPPQ